ncbi:MAG: rhodanese-like domain-containing protein [Gammaproteobacteria bacterium]|nr:rhodanese-like domain-containing protein [Gammaproteobacteria bacterium]MCH9715874.1 rhodanese-like domain-containing protein [Gammaproteobacteria bacterium]MCH9763702.1 rhodanese-like domain-containing protein [Gammaproteobacteria bacterium]
MIKTMDAAALKQGFLDATVVVVDVREPDEYADAHILGAVLIPLGSIVKESLPDVSGKKLVLHCRSGKRSAYACEQLMQAMPALDVYNLEGGILAWIAQGYPVESLNRE